MQALFDRMRLAPRLALAFALVLSVNLIADAIGIWRLHRLEVIAEDLGGASAERALLARELHGIVVISSSRAETLLQIDNPGYAASINADRKATSEQSEKVRKRLEALSTDARSRALLATVDEAGNAFRKARDGLVKRKAGGERVASDEIHQKLRPTADAYEAAVDALAAYDRQQVQDARAAAAESEREGIAMLVGGVVAGMLLGGWCAFALARSIVRPMTSARQRADRIAHGDLSAPSVDDLQRDEVQSLVAAISTMQARLAHMVADVRSVSDLIGGASHEIATGNQDLSIRTEQTASSLQQTASSMEQLTATVRQTADASRQASALASSAAEVASRGGEAVSRVVVTMEAIAGASSRIADIVGVIDGIAFQTNILALNAAVEAARAGEQGRGFAVVAGEVRSLAQRSASAAREIKSLIGESAGQVTSGASQVREAGRTIKDIVDSSLQVAEIVQRISLATAEQSQGIAEVNVAVSELDRMTQQNAALVEESAAAAESMKQQTSRLVSVVGSFRLATH